MLKNSKLTTVLEGLMTRYRIGSFLCGDQIKFKDSIKSNDVYKSLPVSELDILNDIIEQCKNGDVIVKIVSLNSTPMTGGTGTFPNSFEIGVDGGGGQYLSILSLPGSLINEIERVDTCPCNVAETIPANRKITYDVNPPHDIVLDPEDMKGEQPYAMIPDEHQIHVLPSTNTKLKGTTAKDIDYSKNIKTKQNVNNAKIDTIAKA